MNYLEKACEEIDASVFSSDMLYDPERLAMFRDYLGRWNRAIEQHEKADDDAAHNIASLEAALRQAVKEMEYMTRGTISGGNQYLKAAITAAKQALDGKA